ncbi:hypothetical protein [Bacillus thuringiensis]|uniref:hypothetical protein n=1 Tax=Bacillus thuringiensis TaxID=1428 RepID=UPI0032C42C83
MSKEQILKKEIIKWVKTMNSDDPEQFNSCVMELEDMLLGYIEKNMEVEEMRARYFEYMVSYTFLEVIKETEMGA